MFIHLYRKFEGAKVCINVRNDTHDTQNKCLLRFHSSYYPIFLIIFNVHRPIVSVWLNLNRKPCPFNYILFLRNGFRKNRVEESKEHKIWINQRRRKIPIETLLTTNRGRTRVPRVNLYLRVRHNVFPWDTRLKSIGFVRRDTRYDIISVTFQWRNITLQAPARNKISMRAIFPVTMVLFVDRSIVLSSRPIRVQLSLIYPYCWQLFIIHYPI